MEYVSFFNGGFRQFNRYQYRTVTKAGASFFELDSSVSNFGKKAPREYYGADAQIKIRNNWGFTELRAEYWQGTQTANSSSSETPGVPLLANDPYYIRHFNGAFFYFLQNIINSHHQLLLKYDWYDPNTDISGKAISNGSNFGPADVRFSTWGFGYVYYINDNLKLLLWYEDVKNEKTSLPGYTQDVKDNLFTCRLQFRF